MNFIKRSLLLILLVISIFTSLLLINTNASTITYVPIPKIGGSGNVTYRGTSVEVQTPSTYIRPETNFRAVWVSTLVGDVSSFSSVSQYKAQINQVIETMEYFNMNVMVFHMRMNNDALYKSSLNPIASAFSKVNFNEFDPIAWTIEECHKRGIEFHAWLNPYRVASGLGGLSIEDFAKKYPSYNAASNPNYLLSSTTSGVILNPGEPFVRKFLIDTCMEIVNNYNIDAIHFDDYFYIGGIDDSVTRSKYNLDNLTIANFRRKQIDLFIETLSNNIQNYNYANNKLVQLGISPTGVYRNSTYNDSATYDANGNLISPIGSNTAGFAHYDSYLYCDTKKWIDNEWIDYILPQSYHSFETSAATYADVMDWWVKVVKNKKVNLYSGMGIYMASDSTSGSWYTSSSTRSDLQYKEASNQVKYASKYSEIKGHCLFSFQHVLAAYQVKSGTFYEQLKNVKDTMWDRPAILPQINTYSSINLPQVSNLNISKTTGGYRLDFNKIEQAKFYVLYRSNTTLSYTADEVIDVIGDISKNGIISYVDPVSTTSTYLYGIKAMSRTNTLGSGNMISTASATTNNNLVSAGDFSNIIISENTYFNQTISVKWDTIYPLNGEKLSYQVLFSYDGQNYNPVTTPAIESSNINQIQKIILNTTNQKVYIKIRAYNQISETISDPIVIDVFNYLGAITNLSVTGEKYAGRTIQFKWNKLPYENVNYVVQYSTNRDVWTNVTTPVVESTINMSQSFTLPLNYSNYYYRILATTDSGKTYTNDFQIDAFRYLGDLNVSVNGIPYTSPIIVNEGDSLSMTWNSLSLNNEIASFRAMMSSDMKTWLPASVFNSANSPVNGTSQILKFGYQYYTVYYRVEGVTTFGRSFSEIIEIRINVDDRMPVAMMKHINSTANIYLNLLEIYK